MTTRIQNLSDLQDRRIMMEKKLPAFGYALILLVAFLMVFLVIWSTQNKRTYVSQSTGSESDSTKRRCPSAYMVSKASDDFPDPDSPVNTTSLSRGISSDIFLRLFTRAPRTTIRFDAIAFSFSL